MCSVRKALCPVFVLASVCGVQMFQYPTELLNYIHFLVVWSTYATAFASLWIWTEFRVVFTDFSYLCTIVINVVTSLMATSLTLLHKKKFGWRKLTKLSIDKNTWYSIVQRIQSICQAFLFTFESFQHCLEGLAMINASLSQLDIPDECNELRKDAWKVIGIWCLTAIYFPSLDVQWMYMVVDNHTAPMVILMVNYLYLINFFAFTIICVVLRYINSRFDRINKYVGALTEQSNKWKTNWLSVRRCGASDLLNPVVIKEQERGFWIMMHVHRDLCKITRDLNRIFGLHITLEIGTHFMYLSRLIIYTFTGYIPFFFEMSKKGGLSITMFAGVGMGTLKAISYILRLVYFNHICESISAKVFQFVLHTVNRPLKFDGAGMFYFGYNFIYRSIGAMSTMLVIIFQSAIVTDVMLLYANLSRTS